jgi:hypothetical protein
MPAAGSSDKRKACPTTVALPTKRASSMVAAVPSTKSNRSGSPPASLARCHLPIGAKEQIPKMKGVGPSTVNVAPKSRYEYFRSLAYIPIALRCFMEQKE